MPTELFSRKLALILIIGAAVRFWMVFHAASINSDAYTYALTTEHIAREGFMAGFRGDYYWPFVPLNKRPICFPLLGSVLYRVTGDAILSLRLVSALAGIALIWAVYVLAGQLFHRETVSLMAAGLAAFQPKFAESSASELREVLMALWLTLAFLALLQALRGDRRLYLWAFAAGLLLFFGFATRPDGAIAVLVVMGILFFAARGLAWKKRLAACVALAVAFWCLEIPYMLCMKHVYPDQWLVNQWQITRKLPPGEQSAQMYLLKEDSSRGDLGGQ